MPIFATYNIEWLFHVTPLHYIPYIMQERRLLSKPSLEAAGFHDDHFRSMSKKQDVDRGFGNYVHLTTNSFPPILKAKLSGGFPHCSIMIPTNSINEDHLDFCRYNVAMNRYLNRPGGTPLKESDENGRYYDGKQIPVARSKVEKLAMLETHYPSKTIEVLKPEFFTINCNAKVLVYSQKDADLIHSIKEKNNCSWEVIFNDHLYEVDQQHWQRVNSYITTVLEDPDWRGDELEFDRL